MTAAVRAVIESMDLTWRFTPEYLHKHLPPAVTNGRTGGTKHRRGSVTDDQQALCNYVVAHHGGHSVEVWRDGSMHLVRPGKRAKDGSSASIITGQNGDALLTVFSSSWPEIGPRPGESSRPWVLGVDGKLHHPGDPTAKFNITASTTTAPAPTADTPGRRRLTLTPASAIRLRPVKWLWQDRVALGTLALVGGREGIGKSILTYQLAADITRGLLPGEHFGTPRPVLVCATEDSWEHTIAPRLTAAGADLDGVFRIDVTTSDDVAGTLTLPTDLVELEAAVAEVGAAAIVLDPLLSRLATDLDSHKDAEVRVALEPLVALADRSGAAILGLIHVNKSTTTDPLTMLMASRAFAAVARAVLFVTVDPEDTEGERRYLGQPKNNLGTLKLPMMVFTIESTQVAATVEGDVWTGKIVWQGEDDRSIADVLHAVSESRGDPTEVDECIGWLRDYLTINSVVLSETAKNDARAVGFKERTLQRARERIGAGKTSAGFPRRTWWSDPTMTPDEVTAWIDKQVQP